MSFLLPSYPKLYHSIPNGVKRSPKWDAVGRIFRVVKPIHDDPVELGKALRDARRRADLSQRALGERVGVSSKLVGRWEAGEERSLGDTPQKRFAVAAQVAAATGDFSLISEQREDDRLAALEEKVEILSERIQKLSAMALDDDEEAEYQRYLTSDPRSAGRGLEGASE